MTMFGSDPRMRTSGPTGLDVGTDNLNPGRSSKIAGALGYGKSLAGGMKLAGQSGGSKGMAPGGKSNFGSPVSGMYTGLHDMLSHFPSPANAPHMNGMGHVMPHPVFGGQVGSASGIHGPAPMQAGVAKHLGGMVNPLSSMATAGSMGSGVQAPAFGGGMRSRFL
jgi:hypothetical protein